jgi:hypothetical protein
MIKFTISGLLIGFVLLISCHGSLKNDIYIDDSSKVFKMRPQNDIDKDTSLKLFIDSLKLAIKHKDTSFLKFATNMGVELSFGGDTGYSDLRKIWKINEPNSKIWKCLNKLISLGGVLNNNNNTFAFPYVFGLKLPSDTFDVFSTLVVTDTNVCVYEKPSKSSKVIAKLSYDLVHCDFDKSEPSNDLKYDDPFPMKQWYFINSFDNKVHGFVYWDYIWCPVDYRMIIKKYGDNWKIVALVNGD